MAKGRWTTFVRVFAALRTFLPIILTHARDSHRFLLFGGERELDLDDRRRRAQRLADAFEELGTTYVKVAQFLTTRPDFVPPVYIQELQRLQDDVEAADAEEVREMLEQELGDTSEVFDSFEMEPLSAASIAQVHRAEVDGEEAAVKIQRPRLRRRVEADLAALKTMVRVLTKLMKLAGEDSHAGTLVSVTLDVEESLREEVDFRREAEVMDEIHRCVEEDGFDTTVVVPELYPRLSTDRVITMSYEDGVKVKDSDELERRGHDLSEVAERIVEAYLRMAFSYGVYQTDPHHGNLAVADDGRVVVYDYGMSVRPPEEVTDAFARFLVGVGTGDEDVAVAALEDLGATEIRSRRQWQAMCRWAEAVSKDVAGATDEIDLGEVATAFDDAFDDFPIQMNQDILYSLRSITGVQGLATSLDPDYDFSSHLARYFVEQDSLDLDLEEIRRDARERGSRIHVDSMRDDVVTEVERASRRAVKSVAASTLILGSGVLYLAAPSVTPLAPAIAFTAGVLGYVDVYLSFRESDGVTGPMFTMRYQMEKWDEPDDTEADDVMDEQPVDKEAVVED